MTVSVTGLLSVAPAEAGAATGSFGKVAYLAVAAPASAGATECGSAAA
jgi:hypothetical protein